MGKKKTKKIYVPQGINLEVTTKEELDKLDTSVDFKKFIYEATVKGIENAVENKKNKIELFDLGNFDLMISITKENYKKSLETIEKFYAKHEEYDVCTKVKKLIEKL